ncbi:MAG: type IX secretion system membrane protein PorP/SprF [Paludibacter sp.]|jgi:type IX secretion system PorP/SprF family membrane protein|nr:type IX secretion system membrane protein PorP/SprF [Paludibacter sp.]
MKRNLIFISILLFTRLTLVAQFDGQVSQYMLNAPGFNPAAIGREGMLDVTGQHRLQWIGMPNGGTTTWFNLHTPLKIGDDKHRVGIRFGNDRVGLFTNQGFHLQYAYRLKVGKGNLQLGIQPGFLSVGFSGDSVRMPSNPTSEYHDTGADPAIPTSALQGLGFDLGAGAWYTQGNLYAGISLSHFNAPVITWSDTQDFTPASTLYFTGGYEKALRNPLYVLKPSVLVQTDFTTLMAELSLLGYYKRQYWGGISYRIGNAVVVMAGLTVANGLAIGYSFDIPASPIIRATWGSHEVMLSYQLDVNTGGGGRRKNYKNVRIL